MRREGELLAETLGLQSWCAVQSKKPFAEALAGLVVGLESQVPKIYSKTTPPLIEKYGFTEEEIVFFRLHIVADDEHGERGFEILEGSPCDDGRRRLDAYQGQAVPGEIRLLWGVGTQILKRSRPNVPTQRF